MVGRRVSWSSANKHGVVSSYAGTILSVHDFSGRTKYLIRLDNGFIQFMDVFIVTVE